MKFEKILVIILKRGDDMNLNYSLRNLGLSGINPIDIGCERCSPSHSHGPAERKYVLIHYVKSGKGIFTRDGVTHEVKEGQCFVIRPNDITYYKADDEDPWYYIWIGFETGDLPRCLMSDILDAQFAVEVFLELEENIEKYNGEYGDGGVREAYACGKISEIMARLQVSNSENMHENSEMEIVKNYIDTSYETDIKIGALAAQFHFENSYFSRAFKKRFGTSPQNYLVEKRLSAAARLMRVYSFTPSAAACAVGYNDIYLFSKMFKRRYGVSPREYKNGK